VTNVNLQPKSNSTRVSVGLYARNIFKLLENHEKNVMLLMDEIHIQPYMDFKGGNIVGNSFNNSSLATAAYTFMIFSITSNFKEVIHIQVVQHLPFLRLRGF
jgi:hypothetical protein